MGAGTALRNAARTAINQLGNDVTLTIQTPTEGVRGQDAFADGAVTNITAATSQNVVPKLIRQRIGNVKAGDLTLYVKDTDTINQTDKVTFNTRDYRIQSTKEIFIENILVVTVVICYLDTP